MLDLRPNLGIRADLVRYYYSRKDNMLKISKYWNCTISPGEYEMHYCRESLADRLSVAIKSHTYNHAKPENTYILIPKSSIEINGKLLACDSSIYLETCNDTLSNYFLDKDTQKQLLKSLRYTVGIIGTCLSNDKEERLRNSKFWGSRKPFLVEERDTGLAINQRFGYSDLSSFWLVSQPLFFLIVGVARNALSCVFHDSNGLEKNLLNKVSYSEVKDTIKNLDKDNAIRILKDYVIPFFEGYKYEDYGYTLSLKVNSIALLYLIDAGYSKIFKPEKMIQYWTSLNKYHGFDTFANTYASDKSLEYYRSLG